MNIETQISPTLSVSTVDKTTEQTSQSSLVWDEDMHPDTRQAIDLVMDHLITTGARPSVIATGNIVTIITSISQTMNAHIPARLDDALTTMMDYTARWLCDYMRNTNTVEMRINFGFTDNKAEASS